MNKIELTDGQKRVKVSGNGILRRNWNPKNPRAPQWSGFFIYKGEMVQIGLWEKINASGSYMVLDMRPYIDKTGRQKEQLEDKKAVLVDRLSETQEMLERRLKNELEKKRASKRRADRLAAGVPEKTKTRLEREAREREERRRIREEEKKQFDVYDVPAVDPDLEDILL